MHIHGRPVLVCY